VAERDGKGIDCALVLRTCTAIIRNTLKPAHVAGWVHSDIAPHHIIGSSPTRCGSSRLLFVLLTLRVAFVLLQMGRSFSTGARPRVPDLVHFPARHCIARRESWKIQSPGSRCALLFVPTQH